MIGQTISHYKFQNSLRAHSASGWNFENPATPEPVEGWRELRSGGIQ